MGLGTLNNISLLFFKAIFQVLVTVCKLHNIYMLKVGVNIWLCCRREAFWNIWPGVSPAAEATPSNGQLIASLFPENVVQSDETSGMCCAPWVWPLWVPSHTQARWPHWVKSGHVLHHHPLWQCNAVQTFISTYEWLKQGFRYHPPESRLCHVMLLSCLSFTQRDNLNWADPASSCLHNNVDTQSVKQTGERRWFVLVCIL